MRGCTPADFIIRRTINSGVRGSTVVHQQNFENNNSVLNRCIFRNFDAGVSADVRGTSAPESVAAAPMDSERTHARTHARRSLAVWLCFIIA